MFDLDKIKKDYSDCECGVLHNTSVKEAVIGSGITEKTGEILKRNGFGEKLLVIADENTLKAANGVEKALDGFKKEYKIYDNLREATVSETENVKKLLAVSDGVIAVGTGSLHDISRKAAADLDKKLCLFATAPSMDGFASYSSPLVDGNFKITYPAKSPEVIIGDTRILAKSPVYLKSAGFGDMVGKYVGLIDWQTSHLISGEYYCEKIAALTRKATDKIMSLSERITADDEESAGEVFKALLLTGIGMSFVKSSRPASGTEHILSHFWECKKLLKGELSDFHGKKVGVATLLIMKEYKKLLEKSFVKAHKEINDWQDIYNAYGELKDEVIKLNTPTTITDDVNPRDIEKHWDEIRKIIASVPNEEEIYSALKRAGCATTAAEIGVSENLKEQGLKYHPYMRRRLSLYRLKNMID